MNPAATPPPGPLTPVRLAPQQRRVLEGLALGMGTDEVAYSLSIATSTASDYVRSAKEKLRARDIPSAVAMAYATGAITVPVLRLRDEVYVSAERQALIPAIAQGWTQAQIAAALNRSALGVRTDYRGLLDDLAARNTTHLITRAWEFQLLTVTDVARWPHRATPLPPAELRARLAEVSRWENRTSPQPSAERVEAVSRDLVAGGTDLVRELAGQVAAMPPASPLARDVRGVLADASRRLSRPDAFATPDAAVTWAIRATRAISTLLYASAKLHHEQGR
ncbi:LuxR C-terminal-related transcriptional regulator [Streptomyces sp. NPDC092359]|uniref:LuxR C-terminal-related transcriptional regulator n=1 Tax=Streptomyces sp. NPDC092359 TaxID=3366014 RepID=UPI00381F7A71